MNRTRRASVKRVIGGLSDIQSMIESILEEEQDALDAMPENLEGSDMYGRMEDSVDALDNALDSIESAIEDLRNAAL